MKKLVILSITCIFSACSSTRFTLPKVEVDGLYDFRKDNPEWSVTFGNKKICFQHGKKMLSDGEIVNFCREAQSNCGPLHQHFTFKVKDGQLVFCHFRESLHGKILRKGRKLDDYRLRQLNKLKSQLAHEK